MGICIEFDRCGDIVGGIPIIITIKKNSMV
jgi:hypothetical protein